MAKDENDKQARDRVRRTRGKSKNIKAPNRVWLRTRGRIRKNLLRG